MAVKSQLNFLPEDYLERRRQQRTNILCLALFGIVMAGLTAAFLLKERREASAAEQRQEINHKMDAVAQQLAQFEEKQKRKERMIQKADVTASLLERRPRHYLLALLTDALPPGSGLLSIELSTKEDKPKSGTPQAAGSARGGRTSRAAQSKAEADAKAEPPKLIETLKVTGLAPNDKVVSQFIARLDGSPLFRRVDLIFSEEHAYQEQAVRRFMLQIELDEKSQVTDEMVQSLRMRPGAFE